MRRKCKVCPTKIIFAEEKGTGKTQVLDASAPVYKIWQDDTGKVWCEKANTYGPEYRVSHFSTCRGVDAIKRSASTKK